MSDIPTGDDMRHIATRLRDDADRSDRGEPTMFPAWALRDMADHADNAADAWERWQQLVDTPKGASNVVVPVTGDELREQA